MGKIVRFGPFVLDAGERRLRRGDQIVPLSPKAFDLLFHFTAHPNQVLTRDQLFESLWPDTHVDDHALSVQIHEIRRALGDDAHASRYIETRHRRGYCFKADVAANAPGTEPQPADWTHPLSAAPQPARAIPETHYARSGDVNIAYQVTGHGPVDVVFVMGWISHLEYFWTEPRFARFLRRLASSCRLILFDKRGTGLSDRVPLDQLPGIEQRMDDLRAVMDAAGSKKAVLCGISEGGCMSAAFAATFPEKTRGLVMIGPYAKRLRDADYPWAPTREERDRFLDEIRDHWGGPIGLEERAPTLADDPHFREWWAAYLRMGASPGAALALTRMNTEVDIRPLLPLIQTPTLVIHRTGDRCLKVEEGRYVASRIPGAQFVELEGNDHLPFVGDQDAVLAAVEEFLDQIQLRPENERALATVLVASFDCGLGNDADSFEPELRAQLNLFRSGAVHVAGRHVIARFDGPARAVRCACSILAQATHFGFDARAGLHTGECVGGDCDSLAGPAVDVASEIHARCGPREVLVSGTLRDLTAGAGLRFAPRGRLELGARGEWQILAVTQ